MVPTPFEPSIDEIRLLDAAGAVDMLRDILHVEAASHGVPATSVVVTSDVTSSDGGLDGEVTSTKSTSSANGLIFPGRTGYQSKAGFFSFGNKRDVRGLVLRPASRTKQGALTVDDVLPRVLGCLESGGTFVIMLTGSDTPEQVDDAHVNIVRVQLERVDPKFSAAKIKILYPNQLTKLVTIAPGRALTIKKLHGLKDVHSVEWMAECSGFDDFFEPSELQLEAIAQIRGAIGSKPDLVHIRVVGEPGSGKTRLVYEALRDSGLASRVIFCPDGDQLLTSGFLDQVRVLSARTPLILAVDECDAEARTTIHKVLRTAGKNITLVTCYNEVDELDRRGKDYLLLEPPPLADTEVTKIVESYGVPPERAKQVAKLCDGSPLAAHHVGKSLASSDNIQDILTPQGLDDIWDHYLASSTPKGSSEYRELRAVITCLALFKRFGWGEMVNGEAKLIYQLLIVKLEPALSWPRFVEIVNQLIYRKTLQGRSTLYIRPKLLHVKLWCDWWLNYAMIFEIPVLLESFEGQLRDWFTEMFIYARESPAATRVVVQLLAEDGPFKTLEGFRRESNSLLLFKLAQVNPMAAARRIREALGSVQREELIGFDEGRRNIVHALQHTALYVDSFEDSAIGLLLLAEAENENWSNNASGVFAELFSLGYAKMAPTALPPLARLPMLVDLAGSTSVDRVRLALRGFDYALRTQLTRTDIGSQHGLRDIPDGWTPATYGELWNCYRAYLSALWKVRGSVSPDLKDEIARSVLSHTRSLLPIEPVAEVLLDILADLAHEHEETALLVVNTIVGILHYDKAGLSATQIARLEGIQHSISDGTFAGQMKRYVRLNLLEDKFDEAGELIDGPAEKAECLARQVINAPSLLDLELAWLVTGRAENGHAFGSHLGRLDDTLHLWRAIHSAWVNAGEDRSDYFVGGYLRGVFETNALNWEGLIREIFESQQASWVPPLVWRSGMSRPIAELLILGAEEGKYDAKVFRLLSYGAGIREVPLDLAKTMIDLLIQKGAPDHLDAALELFQTLVRAQLSTDQEMIDIGQKILAHSAFFAAGRERENATMRDYHWTELGLRMLQVAPESAVQVAEIAIEKLGTKGSVVGGFSPQSFKFLDAVTEQFPARIWARASSLIDPEAGTKSFYLMQWMHGNFGHRNRGGGALSKIPVDLVISWIKGDIKNRAWYIAEYSPFVLNASTEASTLTRALLEKFGNRKDVRSSLHANFHTEGWTGSSSSHYRSKLETVLALNENEKDVNVQIWLREEVDRLKAQIAEEDVREERGF